MAEWSPLAARSADPIEYEYGVAGASVLVTGASRGIGAEVARCLAAGGASSVALMARTREALDSVAAAVREYGARTSVHACDVTDGEALIAAVRELTRVDVLVHGAGVNIPQSLATLDVDVADRVWATNVRSALHLTKLTLPLIPAGGVVIFLSSQLGHAGAARRAVYGATKHAIEGVTKALALELAPRRIRVVAVAPTFVDSPMTAPLLDELGFRERALAEIPLGRLGSVRDVAAAVRFAASPAAAMITGSSIRVDGGWTAR